MDDRFSNRQLQMRFVLFVAGESPRSRRARESVSRAFEARGLDPQEVRIIDALTDPEQTLTHRIVAVPTLMTAGWSSRAYVFSESTDEQRLGRWLDGMLDPQQIHDVVSPADTSDEAREPGDTESVREGDRR